MHAPMGRVMHAPLHISSHHQHPADEADRGAGPNPLLTEKGTAASKHLIDANIDNHAVPKLDCLAAV